MRAPEDIAREMVVSTPKGPAIVDGSLICKVGSAEAARILVARLIARFREEAAAVERAKVERLLGRVCRAWIVEQNLPDPYAGIEFEGIRLREEHDDLDPDEVTTREDLSEAQLAVEADLISRGLIATHADEPSLTTAGMRLVLLLEREEEEYRKEKERLRELNEERPPSRRKSRLRAARVA